MDAVEDEDHLLLVCPRFQSIRAKFAEKLAITPISSIGDLFSTTNTNALARFVVLCLDERDG